MGNTNPRCAFAHPLGLRYVPLLLVCPPRPLRAFASLNAHLQVHLGLGGKPRSGLRPHSLNRAASPCCGLRTSSGRFNALTVQRKAMRCPSAAISQRYCSKHPPQLLPDGEAVAEEAEEDAEEEEEEYEYEYVSGSESESK